MLLRKELHRAMKNTSRLLSELKNAKSFVGFADKNTGVFLDESIADCLQRLCFEKNTEPAQVIRRSGIDRTYGYQLFNGRRLPSRDKLIQLGFGFPLALSELQPLLRMAGKSQLYPKIKRDAAIIYGLNNNYSVIQMQNLLGEQKLPLLDKYDEK